jgi:guanylate kinase
MNRGILFVLSAPSGAGKTTLCNRVMRALDNIVYSVSHTTRPIRDGEVDGRDYHFVSVERFMSMVDSGEFLEWAEVHGNFYGTSVAAVRTEMEFGRDVILDIDVQGAARIRRDFPDAVTVFIMPPSMEELEKRLRGRGTDSEDVIAGRMENAAKEIRRVREYDFTIINDDLDRAASELVSIFVASRCRTGLVLSRNEWLRGMVGDDDNHAVTTEQA